MKKLLVCLLISSVVAGVSPALAQAQYQPRLKGVVYPTTGQPAASVGVTDDFAFDASAVRIYRKISGSWDAGTALGGGNPFDQSLNTGDSPTFIASTLGNSSGSAGSLVISDGTNPVTISIPSAGSNPVVTFGDASGVVALLSSGNALASATGENLFYRTAVATNGAFLTFNTDGTSQERTAAQVRSDIGAGNGDALTSGTLSQFATGGTATATHMAGGTGPSVSVGTLGTGSKNNAGFITVPNANNQTYTLTFSVTAPNGWVVIARRRDNDRLCMQTGQTTTTGSFSYQGSTNDVINYIAFPY